VHSLARRGFIAMLGLALAASAAEKNDEAADKIVISGASGGLAGETLDALMGRGVPVEKLILVTRTPEKLSSFAERGADVRAGDFTKPELLPAAFAGGKQLLLISVNGGDRLAQHTAAIGAARRAGIKHIVYTSWINAVQDNPAAVTRDHIATEEAVRKSGIPYTILRNQRYAEGLLGEAADAMKRGVIVTNAGRGKWAPVSRKDCAAAAAAVLATSGHEGRTYDITGPDLISQRDFAALITQVTGKSIRVAEVDDATYVATLMTAGVPEAGAKVAATFGVATRTNYLNIKSQTLELLLGRKPRSVRELLEEHKAELLAPAAAAAH
jgi:NAD(P)H dehydrogenase (quinone)